MKTYTRTTYAIPGTELEVVPPHDPSGAMHYKDPLVAQVGDKTVLGYLADDHDCENPLTSGDGMGAIYECRRHGPTLRDYERVLALGDFEGGERDKHAVLLDVYEHGGVRYSLSGQGMRCQFDTARAGAVWVPDDHAREEVVRRGEVYRKGDVNELLNGRYEVRTLHDDTSYTNVTHPDFANWHEAFDYLEGLPVTYERDQVTAEQIAARELAEIAAEEYTSWSNGNCYGVIVVTYDAAGEEVAHDACWGHIGDDYAYEALKSDYFAPIVASLESEHAAAD